MLTDSGFRESVAEERVRKGFVAAGAAEGALALLVDRRLLRVEDRLDQRRVEITHDVLCSVIGASRNARREREALEESKRQLAAQREREAATRRALSRARRIAAVAVVIMLAAVGSAVFGWINLRRARAADAEAQAARRLTELARGEAEKLVGFLLEDFYEELKPTGRVEIVSKLADKAVAYYDGLPPELINTQTKLYRGLALTRKASALTVSGKLAEAKGVAAQARKIFEELRAAGDQSDEVIVGFGLTAYSTVAMGIASFDRVEVEQAVNLLRPLIASGRASRAARLTQADLLQYLAHSRPDAAEGIALCEESRKILADMGALNLSDLTAASIYGDVTDSQSRMAQRLGRTDEAEQLSLIVVDTAEKVLEQRPGDLRAMMNRYYAANMLGTVAMDRDDFSKAEVSFARSADAARNYTLFNPVDSVSWNLLITSGRDLAGAYLEQGRVADAERILRQTAALEHDPRNKTGADAGVFWAWRMLAGISAQQGNLGTARTAIRQMREVAPLVIKDRNLDQAMAEVTGVVMDMAECDILAAEGDHAAIRARAADVIGRLGKIKTDNGRTVDIRDENLRRTRILLTESALRLGNFEEAVTLARQAVEQPITNRVDKLAFEEIQARAKVRLGQALLGADKPAEALVPLREALTYYRGRQARGAVGTNFRQDFARVLYHLARAQSADAGGRTQALALLNEAMTVLGGLTIEAQQLRNNKELLKWVSNARREARAGE